MSNWINQPFTQVDVLRHGACEGGEIYRGSTDVPLSERGHQQMCSSTQGMHWNQIVSSPLRRCREFAEHLSESLRIPLHIDERWREFSFGVWDGRPREEIWAESPDQVKQFFSDPVSFTPENGDSYLSVRERVRNAWNEILETHESKHVLVVTHGGVIRTLYSELKSLPSEAFNCVEVPYACLSRWKHYPTLSSKQPILSFHNRHQDLTVPAA